MIYLHKIIPLITSPLFFVLTLLVILIILRKSKLIKLKNSLLFLSFLTLFLFSNPLISNKLVKYIDKLNLNALGEYRPEAIRIFDKTGWK